MNNRKTLTLIHDAASDYGKQYYRAHKDWKKDYNAKYYQEHKQYWRDYYGTNGSRSTRLQQVDLGAVDFKGLIDQFTRGRYSQGASGYKLATEISDGVVNAIVPIFESNVRESGGGRTSQADFNNAVKQFTDYAYDEIKKQLGNSATGAAISKKQLEQMFRSKMTKTYDSLTNEGVLYTRPMEREKNVTGTANITVRRPGSSSASVPSSAVANYSMKQALKAAADSKAKSANRSVMVSSTQVKPNVGAVKTSSSVFSKLASAGKSFVSMWKLGFK